MKANDDIKNKKKTTTTNSESENSIRKPNECKNERKIQFSELNGQTIKIQMFICKFIYVGKWSCFKRREETKIRTFPTAQYSDLPAFFIVDFLL